jgi:hypothetical protein
VVILSAGTISATTSSVQVQSLTGGFLAGCTINGCGGEFQAMENGAVNGSGMMVNGNKIFVYCVDFLNDVFIPSQIYTANISTITTGSDLSNTVYGRADSAWAPGDPDLPIVFTNTSFATTGGGTFTPTSPLQRYQMTAWLISQYSAPSADRNAIQYAIWNVLQVTPPAGESSPAYPKAIGIIKIDENLLLKEAADFVSGPETVQRDNLFNSFKILTEVAPTYLHSPTQIQEFMYINPEPATMGILVGGAFGILALVRSRRKRTAA